MLELHRYGTALLHVFALIPVFSKADVAILCEDCNGRRWLLCDFCKGQKTNIAEPLERGLAEDIENVYKLQCSFLQCRLIFGYLYVKNLVYSYIFAPATTCG
ncbi:hypothetical protein D8674_030541 [Pyrus ussuriensis x Pyrus communis]|uniref:Uncharacterized protein n=1 Tax=Pyrus ussuriensis x Pyrus communis TaxID=2448454 RepID=A0A5N5EYN9_9ROSA|nr:hypothetical protein D8674_030541 [Pyrus ussuriensis x Pyrus communis]